MINLDELKDKFFEAAAVYVNGPGFLPREIYDSLYEEYEEDLIYAALIDISVDQDYYDVYAILFHDFTWCRIHVEKKGE